MTFARTITTAVCTSVVALTLLSPASSQDQQVTASHLEAARAAIGAINATSRFDNILPSTALSLKSQLIQDNPNLESVISATVDEKALEIAGRRGDLETEAALVYATYFSEDELRAIADFYASDAGQKLLAEGPKATRDVLRAADIWSRGVARDLAESTGAALNERVGETAGSATE